MRGPAALTAVHGWAGAAGGALLTSPIAQSFGDRSSAVLSLSTPSPYCSAQLCSPARLLLSVFFEFLHFLSFFFFFNPTANDKTEQLPDNVQTQK